MGAFCAASFWWSEKQAVVYAQKTNHAVTTGPGHKAGSDAGRKLFESTCAGCHGLDGRGGEKVQISRRGLRYCVVRMTRFWPFWDAGVQQVGRREATSGGAAFAILARGEFKDRGGGECGRWEKTVF